MSPQNAAREVEPPQRTETMLTQSDESLMATQPFSTQDLSQSQHHASRVLGTFYSINPKHTHIELTTPETLFGRRKHCDKVFQEVQISGEHCRIVFTMQGNSYVVTLQDLSSNGTYVNGEKVGQGNIRVIRNGDHIALVTPKLRTSANGFGSYLFKNNVENYSPSQNDEIYRHYDIRHEIGKGTFSVVKYAIHKKTGTPCAVKVMNKRKVLADEKSREQLKQEVSILQRIQHPNIVSYMDVFEGEVYVYLVLSYAGGGELFDYAVSETGIDESQARKWFGQMLSAVNYLHENNITHRDIKLENILLDDEGNVKLSDFGLAKLTGFMDDMKTLCGTPQYVAPEIIALGMPEVGGMNISGYDEAVDMWSLGVTLYFLLTGEFPFYSEDRTTLFRQIASGSYQFPSDMWDGRSDAAKDLVRQLLIVNPRMRITADAALRHPWITQGNKQYPMDPPMSIALHTDESRRKRSYMDVCLSDADVTKSLAKENMLNPPVKKMRAVTMIDGFYY